MDPITAFSLACGVIQVVDFGSRAVSMCKEMYEKGELSEYKELEVTTRHLSNAQNDIQLPSTAASATALQKPQDKELSEIAKDCSAIAKELNTKLETLKAHDPRRKRDRIKMGLKAFREKSSIQELQRRLDSYRKALDTHILLGLRQQLDLITDLGSPIQDLSQNAQTIITKLSQGTKAFDELAKAIRNEHAQTREHITENFLQYQQIQDHKEYRKRLLDSLWFNELWSREERIADAHRETFEWIFDSTGRGVGRWDSFVEWLECGNGIYWINGKAGSGKSTLMSFLGQDSRIPESLKAWVTGKSILVPKFYFWSSGTPMERSTEGLLRSLLWQILDQLPDLHGSDLGPRNSQSIFAEPIAAWTERRLRAQLIRTIQYALRTHRLCFFIDGLDEFAGDQAGLISLIQDTVQSPGIKMCLSSRPDHMFVQAFASSATLQLQDLTKTDIRRFIMDELQGVSQVPPMASQEPDWLQNLTEGILSKAHGVFLWVSLAVKDQVRGLRNGDSVEQLEERLTYLPDEVEGIYARMLRQIEKPYRREASIFMQIALYGDDSSLLSHVLAFHENLDAVLSSDDAMPELEFVAMSDRIRKRIAIVCAGLLEVEDREQENSEQENSEQEDSVQVNDPMSRIDQRTKGKAAASETSELDEEISVLDSEDSGPAYEPGTRSPGEARGIEISRLDGINVTFIHRTAVDFMRNQDAGENFLKDNTASGFDPRVFRVKVLLAKLRLFGYRLYKRDVEQIMSEIWIAEQSTGCEQTILCQLMDGIMSRIDQQGYPEGRHRSGHWSLRWPAYHGSKYEKEISELKRPREFHPTTSWSRPLDGENMDFLLLAASYGLHRYVQHNLNYRSLISDRDAAAYLLYISMVPPVRGGYPASIDFDRALESLDVANEILKRDVNLNYKVNGDLTVWSMFVWRMHHVLRSRIFFDDWMMRSDDVRNALASTALLFIDKGADLAMEEILNLSVSVYMPRCTYVVWLDLSVLAVLESCLAGHEELFRIREACKSAGAFSYARCSRVEVEDGETREEHELSNSESSAFLRIYYRDFTQKKIRHSMTDEMEDLFDRIRKERKQGRNDESTLGEADVESTEERSSDFGITDETGKDADF